MTVTNKVVATLNAVPGPVAAWFRHDAWVARALRPLINRLVPAGPTWVAVRSGAAHGVRLLIDPKTEKYYWTGTHEVPVQEAMSRLLKPGMTFWDVGAHVGFFSLIAGRLVGVSGHVHTFEPMPDNRERLLAAVTRNKITNITVHAVALAATDGEAVLYAHASSLMWTLLPGHGQKGLPVRCRTLDDVARSLPAPDLIKIDAEGAEVEVLRGGMQSLSRMRPRLIVEFSDDALRAEARELLPFYSFTRLAPSHWLLLDGEKSRIAMVER